MWYIVCRPYYIPVPPTMWNIVCRTYYIPVPPTMWNIVCITYYMLVPSTMLNIVCCINGSLCIVPAEAAGGAHLQFAHLGRRALVEQRAETRPFPAFSTLLLKVMLCSALRSNIGSGLT